MIKQCRNWTVYYLPDYALIKPAFPNEKIEARGKDSTKSNADRHKLALIRYLLPAAHYL
jgi:hypothetical protein